MKYKIRNPKSNHNECCSMDNWDVDYIVNTNSFSITGERNENTWDTDLASGSTYRYWVNKKCVLPAYSLKDLVKDCR